MDGVICGHIHWAADRLVGDVRYLNCGDWVDTCSAVVEWPDGRIEVIGWGVGRPEHGFEGLEDGTDTLQTGPIEALREPLRRHADG